MIYIYLYLFIGDDILISDAYDIYRGQDLGQYQGRDKNLHPPNISWIPDVNKTCFLHVTK